MHRSTLPFLALLLAGGTAGFGQTPAPDLESELAALLNTPVQSASKRAQRPIESPQAVEVITAEQIRAAGVFRLVDILRLATSVTVWDLDPSRANIVIRGVNPSQSPRTVQLLIDGVPMYNIHAQPIDLNGLPVPVDAIERVEIVRGPSSSLYGANAQMGVVSITTKRAKETLSGNIRAAGVNQGGFRGQAYLGLIRDSFSLTGAFGTRTNRDQEEPLRVIGIPGLKATHNSASHEQQLFLRPEFKLGSATRVWLAYGEGTTGHFTEQALAAPVLGNANNTMATSLIFPDQSIRRTLAQAGWSQDWSPTLKSEARLSQKVFSYEVAPIVAGPTGGPILNLLATYDPALRTRHDFYYDKVQELAFQLNWDPSAGFHVVLGADTKAITGGVNLTLGLPTEKEVSASGGFVSVDWSVGPLILSAGARAANETLGGTSFSPRASALWKLDDNTILRAGFFTSTRSPMIQEKFASIPDIPVAATIQDASIGLENEEVTTTEIGFRKQWPRWSLEVTYFEATLKKLIAQAPTGEMRNGKPVLRYQNSTRSPEDKGLEFNLTGELAPGLMVGLNASTADFKDPVYALDQQADYTPKSTANVWMRYRKGVWFAYGALQQVGSYTGVATYRNTTGAVVTLRDTVEDTTQVHFQVGMEFRDGLTLSAYGVNAGKAASPSGIQGLANTFAFRNTRREIGLQGTWRF